jgi:uncharacterized protein
VGGRTVGGGEESGEEWKYVSVRRLAVFIEEGVFRGLVWVVFEPNGENSSGKLEETLRLNVSGVSGR